MSAPPDVRTLPPSATPPGGATGRGVAPGPQVFMSRHHPHQHQRHMPNNVAAVSAAAVASYHQQAAAAGLDVSSPSKRLAAAGGNVGVPQGIGGAPGQFANNMTRNQNLAAFTAAFANASAGRQHYDLAQMRVGGHHTTVGLTPGIPVTSYTSSREAFVRGGPQSGSDHHRVPLPTAATSSATVSDLRTPQQVAAVAVANNSQSRLPIRQYPPSLYHGEAPVSSPYLREQVAVVAASAPGVHIPLHPSASSLAPGGRIMENIPNKRPRLDMGGNSGHSMGAAHHLQPGPSSRGHPSLQMPSNVAAPLRIDTRDTVKESGYHPQVEAISPTGPEVTNERDELRSSRDDLLQKISKIDREIAKAESQIAKLKKKQQELEDSSSRPLSEDEEEEERPHHKSIAQIIYAENRRRAKKSHASLAKFAPPNTLPLYNQPSDTEEYLENKRRHTLIKRRLVDYFKQQNDQKEARERYMLETYAKLMCGWQKRVERSENMKKRKEREAKARELYEKIFPELKKQREDKERDHRLGSRGTVRSEADMEDVIERLQERENEDKKMHSYAVVPPLLLPSDERKRKFTNNNGLILDPLKEYNERKFLNTWTDSEKEIFKEKFLQTPKNFGQIAQFLERKTVSDCVQYYYLSKKTENYKQLMRRVKVRRGNKRGQHPNNADTLNNTAVGVVTRHRNQRDNNLQQQEQSNNKENNSNRSTPQPPSLKPDLKIEEEDSDKKASRSGKGSSNNQDANDTSDEEESTQQAKTGLGGKVSNCPIPSCTATKGRVKGRLRHLPKKWSNLSKDTKETITSELQIPNGTKKCCSACFTRISRKINQILGGNSLCNSPAEPVKAESDIVWSEDEIESIKTLLRQHGRNWATLADKISAKSPEQCKKFFYNNRRKLGLDRIMLEYKKSNLVGDQPPSLSTDEESGSSTSSCEEDNNGVGINHNNTPLNATGVQSAAQGQPQAQAQDLKPVIKAEGPVVSIKTEVKVEEDMPSSPVILGNNNPLPTQGLTIRPLGKEEDYDSSATMSADERDGGDARHPGQSNFPGGIKNEYPRPVLMSPANIRPNVPGIMVTEANRARAVGPYPPGAMKPPTSATGGPVVGGPTINGPNASRDTITVKELMINVIERSLSNPQSSGPHVGSVPTTNANLPRTMAQGSDPTIHNILEHAGPNPTKVPFPGRMQTGPGPPPSLLKPGSMAPPSVVRPPPSVVRGPPGHQNTSAQPSQSTNECETLDLSMPRRRDPTPPPAQNLVQPSHHYREPQLSHHLAGEGQAPSRAGPPPPAHSGNKVKTNPDPYFRGDHSRQQAQSPLIYGPDGRPLASVQHVGQPPGLAHARGAPGPPSATAVTNQRPTVRTHNLGYPAAQSAGGPTRHAQMSPKLPGSNRSFSGSITQGTPVNHGMQSVAHRSAYDAAHMKVSPHERVGSITHGTPLYDKKHSQVINLGDPSKIVYERAPQGSAEYFRRTVSPAGSNNAYNYPPSTSAQAQAQAQAQASSSRGSPYVETHMSSRQVIINDFAMARSTEMQRRPDSREQGRPLSPPRHSGRDPSPRPRSLDRVMTDPRNQIDLRRDVRSMDPRFDPRLIDARLLPEHRGDPKADLRALDTRGGDPRSVHESRVSLEHRQDLRIDPRGDPRAGLDPRGDPRATLDPRLHDPRRSSTITADLRMMGDPRARMEHHDPRRYPSFPAGGYITPDGKVVQHPGSIRDPARTPPRSSPAATPPERSSAVIHRQGSLTSGKPVVPKSSLGHREVEIYRTNPEVTISKTSSPRQIFENNALASLVDVAVQQPKLPDGKDRAAQIQRQAYERQLYEMRVAASQAASMGPARASGGDITLQVRNERAKQLSLMQDKDRYERAAAASAAMAKATAHPGVAGAGNGDRSLTAASLIDAIITHSIHSGPNQDPSVAVAAMAVAKQIPYRQNPGGELSVSATNPMDDKPGQSSFKVSRSPSLKGENTNGPDDGSAHGSRPGSRSSATIELRPPSEHSSEMQMPNMGHSNADGSAPEQHWKRRGYPNASGVSAASVMPAPRPSNTLTGVDERSITRVPQTGSPIKNSSDNPGQSSSSSLGRPGIEPISPPLEPQVVSQNGGDQRTSGKKPGEEGTGLSPLEYMKNKIAEEMKKSDGSGGSRIPLNAASTDSPATITPLKRQADNHLRPPPPSSANTSDPHSRANSHPSSGNTAPQSSTDGDESMRKKPRLDEPPPQSLVTGPNSAPSGPPQPVTGDIVPPDSPGSEGEMVIDESVVSDSAPPKEETPSKLNSMSAGQAPVSSMATSGSTGPQYEPLSDDE
ncbi:nuclear receptor corepressor 2-like isoform X2 [Tigriopus californicus]|uniref:nuclear receptor corepressor 2-like isoform X2 n=1 Tax=Tigriopus californicus TaxID=6832 RepID=UPI0027D9ED9D|nr:nuclear receptor corepressor 2-like isoform X2 [Tigriopus californicus]